MPDDEQPPQTDIFSEWARIQASDPSTRRMGVKSQAPPPTVDASTPQPPSTPTPPAAPTPPPTQSTTPSADDGAAPGYAIANTARSQIGKTAPAIRPFLQTNGQSLDPTRLNWCAAFVNGVLNANGVEGVSGPTKNIATSFLGWGQPVQGDVQPGDVLVQPRGHPMGGLGGHIGIATGDVATGNGRTYYLMQSGNYAGRVSYSWEPAGSVVARRAPVKQQPEAQQ